MSNFDLMSQKWGFKCVLGALLNLCVGCVCARMSHACMVRVHALACARSRTYGCMRVRSRMRVCARGCMRSRVHVRARGCAYAYAYAGAGARGCRCGCGCGCGCVQARVHMYMPDPPPSKFLKVIFLFREKRPIFWLLYEFE